MEIERVLGDGFRMIDWQPIEMAPLDDRRVLIFVPDMPFRPIGGEPTTISLALIGRRWGHDGSGKNCYLYEDGDLSERCYPSHYALLTDP
jgi:hypothetical protein